ncbi:Unknown protein, partial [Striga hermonthica]
QKKKRYNDKHKLTVILNTNKNIDQFQKTYTQSIEKHILGQKKNIDQFQKNTPECHYSINNLKCWDIGDPSYRCLHCGAIFWYAERLGKPSKPTVPKYSICCNHGFIELPPVYIPPPFMCELIFGTSPRSKHFQENSRSYNNMFCFTSMGGKIDNNINNGSGPPVFRLHGQNYHLMGSLLPDHAATPKFAQLYIYDTENKISNRLSSV